MTPVRTKSHTFLIELYDIYFTEHTVDAFRCTSSLHVHGCSISSISNVIILL